MFKHMCRWLCITYSCSCLPMVKCIVIQWWLLSCTRLWCVLLLRSCIDAWTLARMMVPWSCACVLCFYMLSWLCYTCVTLICWSCKLTIKLILTINQNFNHGYYQPYHTMRHQYHMPKIHLHLTIKIFYK